MLLPLSTIIYMLDNIHPEYNIEDPEKVMLSGVRLLPQRQTSAKSDMLYACSLSEGLAYLQLHPDMYLILICVKDRTSDKAAGICDDKRPEAPAIQARQPDGQLPPNIILVNDDITVSGILGAVQLVFEKINEWYISMQDAYIKKEPIQKIFDISEDIIGNTINLTDGAFRLVCTTRNLPKSDPVSLNLVKYGRHPKSTCQLFEKLERYKTWDNSALFINSNPALNNNTNVGHIFRFNNIYFWHIVMCCDYHPLKPGLLCLFQLMVDIVGLYAEREWEDKRNLWQDIDYFMTSLIAGKFGSFGNPVQRIKSLGLSFPNYFRLLKIETTADTSLTIPVLKDKINDLMTPAIPFLYDNSIVALTANTSEAAARGGKLDQFITKCSAKCGVSDICSRPEDVPAAYSQASAALDFADAANAAYHQNGEIPAAGIVTWHDTMLYLMIDRSPAGKQAWLSGRFADALRRIIRFDTEHNSDNLKILHTYIKCGLNAAAAGEVLFMHRNNVRYRIKQIEEIINMDLSDYETRVGFDISYLYLNIYGRKELMSASMPEADN